MNNLRLFYQKKLSDNLIGNLDKKQSHYVSKVMRLRENDEFNVFNESGEWIAQIKKINKTGIEFQIVKQLRSKESRVDIWLAFSPIKSNYFNFMIQKSTELGVTKFIPVIFERSIVRKINNDRLKKIIIEATEQSNRIYTPEIESPVKLQNFLSTYEDKIKLIFTDLNSNKKKISLIKSEKKPLCILIGPEGDFSESERLKILNFKDVETIKLNDNILRSETAAISALSVINFIIN
tara:strand:- start:1743 stop:2450 length:708 start_codon:yes stop_codon:yes gene_type:complete